MRECVYVRLCMCAHKCVREASARVNADADDLPARVCPECMCLCPNVCLRSYLRASSLAWVLPTLPPPTFIHRAIHPSLFPQTSAHTSLCKLSFSLFRRREPKTNLVSLAWAAGTQSSPDGGSERVEHLPTDTAWKERSAFSSSRPSPCVLRALSCHPGRRGRLASAIPLNGILDLGFSWLLCALVWTSTKITLT